MKKDRIIEVKPPHIQLATILIEGDSDLVLNKKHARTIRSLTETKKGKKTVKETPNVWEDIITALHWRDGYPESIKDTYRDITESTLREMLENNVPCISSFGFRKSFCDAVVRGGVDTYSTKFAFAVNVQQELEPIKFSEHYIDEKLMPIAKGGQELVHLNRFSGWSSQIHIAYTENVYTLDQIVNIINMAGFGIGIGSGRSSGYGRYHVVGVE